uniref:Uncharacterized protein n=1 Tax=viral metagenome TaxID=1070528 RepID=A0A6C0B6P3_9ZZZZ
MSVAPPPATYTATNDLNILKNIFVPQYKLSNGYYHASVNSQLPGNVTVGDTTTNFAITLNGARVTTLSDVQTWALWRASENLNMNSNLVYNASSLKFLGGSIGSPYTIDATTGTINVSQYWLKGTALTLSGGLPAWSSYTALTNVNMNTKSITAVGSISLSSGGTLLSPASNVIAFSNAFGEKMRITASGSLSIGTTVGISGYSLNVGGASMFLSNIVVAADPTSNTSNAFFVNISTNAGEDFDTRIGARGANTNLILCTGIANTNKAQISVGGDFTLLEGAFTTTKPELASSIGGVALQNSYVTSRLNISLISSSTLTLASATQATTFLLTGNTTNLVLPGANASQGVYWAIKNVSSGSMNITPAGGSILNMPSPSFVMSSNVLLTIVYSGANSNYYAL